jgi:ParB-like chromosome segregation protein Spo0J
MIIAGHGRLLAAKAMGLAEVRTIELTGLNDAQRRALRLADNKIALGAGWDLDLLKLELGELSAKVVYLADRNIVRDFPFRLT